MSEILQKTRVFWHELGHFAAQYYNELYFGGLGTAHVRIRRQILENQRVDFDGGTQPNHPPDYNAHDPIQNPATMVASSVYGCFFQCLRYTMLLPTCFGSKHSYPNVHGYNDYEKVARALRECLPDADSRDLVEKCIQNQFNEIQNRPEFQDLFKIDITDFIVSEEDNFYVDLNQLKCRFSDFLRAHEDFYQKFVVLLEEIFAQHKN